MTPFLTYLLKSTLSLAVFYLVYKGFMSRMKTHHLNRFVLIGVMLSSAIMPLLNFSLIPEQHKVAPIQLLQEIFKPVATNSASNHISTTETIAGSGTIGFTGIIQFIYILGISFLIVKLLTAMFMVVRLIRKAEHITWNNIMVAIVTELVQPFTFMNRIVMNKTDYDNNRDIILEHEKAHIQFNHATDLFVLELFTLFHWFNPIMWLLRRDLKLIHEYQADEAVINTGIDAQTYQLLVLEKAVGERRFALANQFIQKPILKRFKMIQKTHKPRWAGLKLLLFVPLTALMLQAFSRPKAITSIASAVPLFSVQDSTQQWLSLWTLTNFNKVRENIHVKQVHIPTAEEAKNGMPIPEAEPNLPPMKEKNVLSILINRQNEFMVENERSNLEGAINSVENFINGNPALKSQHLSPEYSEKKIGNLGMQKIPKGVISIQFDMATDKDVLDDLLRGIGEKYLALRQNKAEQLFQNDYFKLTIEQRKIINEIVPVRISFASPKAVAPPPPPPPPKIRVVPPPPPPPKKLK
ncbi:M56 family metallopeptidase [Saccharicrinis sp. FJH54]|uniref:M56 family metallopeptidase n=1 Tax=Saccharicrinis sp. FJH54 TaxID=3344665 RepID=UPI0035D3E0CF